MELSQQVPLWDGALQLRCLNFFNLKLNFFIFVLNFWNSIILIVFVFFSFFQSLLVNTTSEYGFEITAQDFSWIGSLVTLGAALVCLFIGAIIQILGRKLTMLLLVIPFTLGWALVTFASNLAMLYVGRFMLGISGEMKIIKIVKIMHNNK